MSAKQINIQTAEASGDGNTAGFTGTEGGDAGSSGSGTGTTGSPLTSSFQASLQAQAAGKTAASATNPEGTNLQRLHSPKCRESLKAPDFACCPPTQPRKIATVEVQHPPWDRFSSRSRCRNKN